MPSKSVVLVVASFLVVVLIYGPTVTFAKPKLGPITCHTGQGLPSGKTECCQPTLSSVTGRVLLVYCTTCDDTTPPSNCSSRYLTSIGNVLPPSGNNTGPITNGQTGLPSRVGNALPPGNNTGTLGETNTFNPIRNATNTLPPSGNNTGNPISMTSSDNPPGCSKKVPIPPNCTLNPFNNSASNKAQPQQTQTQQTTGHHHKGSSTGASTSTGNSTGR